MVIIVQDQVNEMKIAQAVTAEKIARMQEDIHSVRLGLNDVNVTLVDINHLLSEAQGGWRMFLIIGGAGAAIGSAISYVVHYIAGK